MISKLSTADLRPALAEFAVEMEWVLRENDADKGDSWRMCPIDDLRGHLAEGFVETLRRGSDRSEYVDLANLAMMLWHRCRGSRIP